MRMPRSHEAIVERLVADARPVRRLRSPVVRLVAWWILPAAVLASAVAWHLRSDFGEQLRRPLFVLDLVLLLVGAAVAAWMALRAAVPGGEPRRRDIGLVLAFVGAAVLLLPGGPARTDISLGRFVEIGSRCFLMTVLLAAPPLFALLVALRRGASLAPTSAGALAGTAGFLLAAAAMRVVCPIDDAPHLMAWHMLPIPLGAGLSAVAGGAWLGRWWLRPPGAPSPPRSGS